MKESLKDDIITYLYNTDNRMIQYKNDSKTIDYTYDALGRRNTRKETSTGWKQQNDTHSEYTYDGFSFNNLRERREFVNKWNDVKTLDNHYVRSEILGTRETRWYTSHNLTYKHDSLGSVIGVNEYNSVRPVYYTAFGTGYNQWNDKENYFGYNGKPEDPVTGLYNYGYRDYSPTQGRFTTVDPIKDGNNWYSYCMNDPVNLIDFLGLEVTVTITDYKINNNGGKVRVYPGSNDDYKEVPTYLIILSDTVSNKKSYYEVTKDALFNGDSYQMQPIKNKEYYGEIVDRTDKGYGKALNIVEKGPDIIPFGKLGKYVIGEFIRSDNGESNSAAIQIHVGGYYYNTVQEVMKYASSSGCYTLNGPNAGNDGPIDFIDDLQRRQNFLSEKNQNTDIKVKFAGC